MAAGLAACGPGGKSSSAPRPHAATGLDRPITFTTELSPLPEREPVPATAVPVPMPAPAVAVATTVPTPPTTVAPRPTGRTSCRAVAHIGDSTSVGMTSAAVIPDPKKRLDAQYGRVGVASSALETSGGRSVVERLPGQQNGFEVATRLRAGGFKGCWVIALGTCDAANVARGASVSRAQRIERMMSVIGTDPVMWVDVATQVASGFWANSQMQLWDKDLAATLTRHPNAHIYNWTSQVKPSWFTSDGIHYTSAGFAARASLVADALATAFPG